jgi:hypothetical protein
MDAAVKRRPRFTTAGIPLPRIDQRTIGAMRYRALLDSYRAGLLHQKFKDHYARAGDVLVVKATSKMLNRRNGWRRSPPVQK